MISNFLSQLQNYFSKYFVVGTLFPVLACLFLNGLLAYALFVAWHDWADANVLSVGQGAFYSTTLVVAVVLAAYVLSSISTYLRRKLEGNWWDWIAQWFIPVENARRQRLYDAVNLIAVELTELRERSSALDEVIKAARDRNPQPNIGVQYRPPSPDQIEIDLTELESRQRKYVLIDVEELGAIATPLVQGYINSDPAISDHLVRQYERLSDLFAYAVRFATARQARLQNEFNSNFGLQDVAATRMGNVANTIQSYALRRYHCNFEVVWSNLQRVIQRDTSANASLQEAKALLDFLIACYWLTLASAIVWAHVFFWVAPNRLGYLAAALGGPLVAYIWYRAAVEQYRSFADIVMTSFDSFRLQLLSDLHLRSPIDIEDEWFMWESLDRLMTYGETWNFRYEGPKPS
jgi:hypothetical protein